MNQSNKNNRGLLFEDFINKANTQYQNSGLALINKRPTPVKVLQSKGHHVIKGVYEAKSTVDYDGIYNGQPICFEAKSVQGNRFNLKNIQDHQLMYLERAHKQGAICFFLIEFSNERQIYFVPYTMINHYVMKSKVEKGRRGTKSIPKEDFDIYAYGVKASMRACLDYLVWVDELKTDLLFKDNPQLGNESNVPIVKHPYKLIVLEQIKKVKS